MDSTYLIAGIAGSLFILILIYNSLVSKKNNVSEAFSGIDTQLKKRFDLLPNIIGSIKQYMSHETELLTNITKLRVQANSKDLSPDDKVKLDKKLNSAMKSINIAVENYPEVKASENFLNLERTMNEIESQLSAARRNYNSAVTSYNNALEMFPSNIIAGLLRYQRKELFEINEIERENVNVTNLFKGA